jgi:hypothetical protein
MPMNLNDIHEPSWIFSFLFEAIQWLYPIVFILGLGIAVWAFSRCRKRGYLFIALYFALCVFSQLAMPSINREIQAHRKPDISDQTQQKIAAAVKQAVDKVYAEEGHPVMLAKKTIYFPFGPIVLVVGLWFVAKRESQAHTLPDSK